MPENEDINAAIRTLADAHKSLGVRQSNDFIAMALAIRTLTQVVDQATNGAATEAAKSILASARIEDERTHPEISSPVEMRRRAAELMLGGDPKGPQDR